jgi:hypothetical protein
MTYYPKSQIKINQFTKGNQFQLVSTQEEYVGYFWSTSRGEYFSGRNPQDLISQPLQLIPVIPDAKSSLLTYTEGNKTYKNLKGVNESIALKLPYYQKPTPTSLDYQKGNLERYFAKKINENLYIETDKEVYDKMVKKDKEYAYQYYIIFTLNWLITGNTKDVRFNNERLVSLIEKNYNIEGLREYLGFNYLEFYRPSL